MTFICPVKRHSGLKIRVSQLFGINPQHYSRFKDSLGNPLKGHNGIDLVLGFDNAQKTYGTDLFSPCDGMIINLILDSPMSTKGNGIHIQTPMEIGSDGKQRILMWVLWHLMDIKAELNKSVKLGEYLGDIGNSGYVLPEPTISKPYNGSHLHLGVYPWIKENDVWIKEYSDNGFDGAVDPLFYITNLNPDGWEYKLGLNDIADKLVPIKWAIEKLTLMFSNKGR